jgi:hypothetical protein
MRAVKMATGGNGVQVVQYPGHCREGYVLIKISIKGRPGYERLACVLRKGTWLEYKTDETQAELAEGPEVSSQSTMPIDCT